MPNGIVFSGLWPCFVNNVGIFLCRNVRGTMASGFPGMCNSRGGQDVTNNNKNK